MTQSWKCQLTAARPVYTGSDQPGPVSSRHSCVFRDAYRSLPLLHELLVPWGFWGSESLIIVVYPLEAHRVLLENSKSLFTQAGLVKLSDSQNRKKKKRHDHRRMGAFVGLGEGVRTVRMHYTDVWNFQWTNLVSNKIQSWPWVQLMVV